MSQHASELCVVLVDDLYGELISRIFGVFLIYGRFTFPALLHRCRLTPRQLKHGLAVLIHQQLVLWFTSPGDNGAVYEPNLVNAYALVRSGKHVKTVGDRYGEVAAGVVLNLLRLGYIRVGDLVKAYGSFKYSTAATNGALLCLCPPRHESVTKQSKGFEAKHESPTAETIHQALCTLMRAGLISIVNKSHLRSAADNRSEAEREIPIQDQYVGKLKKEREAEREQAIAQKLKDWRFGTKFEREELAGILKGKKRPLDHPEDAPDSKRQRLHQPLTANGIVGTYRAEPLDVEMKYLDKNLVLRVNHDKFEVVARNKRLVAHAEKCIGATTSKVYAEVLQMLESDLFQCKADQGLSEDQNPDLELDLSTLPQVSTEDLLFRLKDSTEYFGGIGNADASKINMAQFDHPKKRRKKEPVNGDDGVMVVDNTSSDEDEDMDDASPATNISEVSSDSEAPDPDAAYGSKGVEAMAVKPRLTTIRRHLLLLASHPPQFLHHIPATSYHPEKWAVAFDPLVKHLLSIAIIHIISTRFGPLAARLARILDDNGKLDEKTLTALGLINQKTMRSLLSAMHRAGHVELQEIPRDTQRQPSRTLYLWYFDPERCKAKLLDETYKSISRALQRAREEREKLRGLIEKASRTDVIGKEEQLLSEAERTALGRWRAMEGKIFGEVGRLDNLVALFRDY